MSLEVKIPAVGESVTSGMISAWLKNDGDMVNRGDALLTLETDKVSTEITADGPGILRIKAQVGADVKIGETVAVIEAADTSAVPVPAASAPVKESAPEKAAAKKGKKVETIPDPVPSAPEPVASVPTPEPIAPATSPTGSAVPAASGRITRKKLSPLRRKIAAQLVMAQHTAAILTTFNECDMTEVMNLRKALQEDFTKQYGIKLGFMSFFIKAVVSALKSVPQINARLDGEDFVQNHFHDIGVAVGTERGLVVPVVRSADEKTFAELERDLANYATKAREGKIQIEDLQGGVFTISNGGVYGSLLSTPILNPPQSGILGMHKIQERPMAVNGQVQIRPMMYLALSYDHRVVDGKEAVTFLVKVKEGIENPARLLVGL